MNHTNNFYGKCAELRFVSHMYVLKLIEIKYDSFYLIQKFLQEQYFRLNEYKNYFSLSIHFEDLYKMTKAYPRFSEPRTCVYHNVLHIG